MTEEEAKTRWCPMTRISYGKTDVCDNRGNPNGGLNALCLASDCMLWVEDRRTTTPKDRQHHVADGHCGLIK